MKLTTIDAVASMCFAVPALIIGLRAAWYWQKGSEIGIDPGWNSGIPGDTRPIQPADFEGIGTMNGWIFATMEAVRQSCDLNRKADPYRHFGWACGPSSVAGAVAGFL